jgi:aspartate/tyrosine/aromatic aminotransferase
MAFFDSVTPVPPDPIFGIQIAFDADPRPSKVNLSVGVFKNEDLQTPILESVKKAELELLESEKSKTYLPIEGSRFYLDRVGSLVFGEPFWSQSSSRIVKAESVGGTGALRMGADFLKQEVSDEAYLSQPTWPNHNAVMARCGMKGGSYPYYDRNRQQLEFDRMLSFLDGLSPGNIILLHACCHNPTGADLSLAQWRQVSDLMLAKKLVPFFDFAYQGFAAGLEEDAKAIRLFAEEGHEMVVANSFSKNFGLYAERVGALFIATHSEVVAQRLLSKIKVIIRTNYSNPPMHGASIVSHILGSRTLRKEWEHEVAQMRERIHTMRHGLVDALAIKCKNHDFSFLKQRNGLFCFSGLEKNQVDRLIAEYGIYMTADGRMNVVGLNFKNLDYVTDAIASVC